MTRIPVVDRRTALVQAALRVVARDGVAAATTRRIVAEAGMPLASFHYVFASRDAFSRYARSRSGTPVSSEASSGHMPTSVW